MASRFRTLSEAIRFQNQNNPPSIEVPAGSPLSAMFSAQKINVTPEVQDVLRWGFSTWGVEPVTGYIFPNVPGTAPQD